jgi:hypothetical protein
MMKWCKVTLMISKPTTIFLETSVQINRLLGSEEKQRKIVSILSQPNIQAVTTSYVLMEFQRTVWADYVKLYNLLHQHREWDAVAQSLRTGTSAYRPRVLGRCLQILTRTMVDSRVDIKLGLLFLKTQITQDIPRRFWHNVTPLPDSIHCDLVTTGLTKQPDGSYTIANRCRKDMATCHLPDFLVEQRPKLKAIADNLAHHPQAIKDQPRVERLLAEIITNPQAALGQLACWPLGDVIIALQIPSNALLWTVDPDFETLTTALGIQLFKP